REQHTDVLPRPGPEGRDHVAALHRQVARLDGHAGLELAARGLAHLDDPPPRGLVLGEDLGEREGGIEVLPADPLDEAAHGHGVVRRRERARADDPARDPRPLLARAPQLLHQVLGERGARLRRGAALVVGDGKGEERREAEARIARAGVHRREGSGDVLRALLGEAPEDLGGHAEDPRPRHHLEGARGLPRLEGLDPLVADPLAAHLGVDVERGPEGRLGLGIEVEFERGGEAGPAEDAQAVLAEAGERIAHRAETPGLEVLEPAKGVDERVRGRIVGDGVHREVAPREVVLDVVHVLHVIGTAAVGVALLAAEGRDLVAAPPEEHRHRPVGDPGGDRPLEHLHHPLGAGVGGEIEVVSLPPEEEIAHTAPDDPHARPFRSEFVAELEDVAWEGRAQRRRHGPLHTQGPRGDPATVAAGPTAGYAPRIEATPSNDAMKLKKRSAFALVYATVLALALFMTFGREPNGLDVNIDGSSRAQAAKQREAYDLSRLSALQRTVFEVKSRYVEPERIDYKRRSEEHTSELQSRE